MNDRHLLVNCLTLLYCASQITTQTDTFRNLANEIAVNIKLPELSVGENGEAKIIGALRTSVLQLARDDQVTAIDSNEFLQRVRLDTFEDNELFDAIDRGIVPGLSEDQYKQKCLSISKTLNDHTRELKIAEIIGKAAYKVKFEREKIANFKHFVSEVYAQLEPFQNNQATDVDPAIVSCIDFSNLEQITDAFKSIEQMESGESILRCGWQGVNRMLRGGFRRGDEVVLGALQHNYKTGFSLSLFRQIAKYNKPFMLDSTKKPMLIRISFEDSLDMNVDFLYNSIKQNEHKKVEDFSTGVDPMEKAQYVKTDLESNGYYIRMMRVDPTQWSYRDICNEVLKMEAENYEVHAVMLDYLAQVPTTGCTVGPTGSDIRDMYRRVRNFMNP